MGRHSADNHINVEAVFSKKDYKAGTKSEYHVDSSTMIHSGHRETLPKYVASIWQRRHFIAYEAKSKAFGSIKGTVLGKIWLIVDPFLNAAVFYLLFAVILDVSRGIENFVGYLVIGMTFFGVLQAHLGGAQEIVFNARHLIRSFSFPRASLVFSYTTRVFYDFMPALAATIVFIMAMPPHALPRWEWLLLPFLLGLAALFCVGLGMLVATLTALLRDLKFIWPLLGRFWFYISGVFWSIDRFGTDSLLGQAMSLNPGWVFLSLARDLLIYDSVGDAGQWLYFAGWSLALFIIGLLTFWKFEDQIGLSIDR